MTDVDNTRTRLIFAALRLFSTIGLKKTTLEEVAQEAGLTRNTAYRYFKNRKNLVRSAMLAVVEVFSDVADSLEEGAFATMDSALEAIGKGLAELPGRNLFVQLDELSRAYPDIYEEVIEARNAAIRRLFGHPYESETGGRIRRDLNRDVVQIIFTEMVINMARNPELAALDLKPEEIFANVKSIFLHGVLEKEPSA